MAIEMTNTSICFYSAYMTKLTLFGDEPKKMQRILSFFATPVCYM